MVVMQITSGQVPLIRRIYMYVILGLGMLGGSSDLEGRGGGRGCLRSRKQKMCFCLESIPNVICAPVPTLAQKCQNALARVK